LTAEAPTLDWTTSTATIVRVLAWHIYEGLFAIDQNYEVKPLLAQDYSVSADGLTYTIRLRSGIKFHNGQPFTADDAVACLNRWGKLSGGGKQVFQHVASVEKKDPTTVTVVLKDPFGPFLTNLGDPKQSAIMMPAAIAEAAGLQPATQYVGTGPFMFKEWQQNQHLRMVRFPDYQSRSEDWGGLTGKKVAYADELVFYPVTDPSVRLDGVQTGQYHIVQDMPADVYQQVAANPQLVADVVKVYNMPGFVLNKARGLFSDVRARQAMLYALQDGPVMAAAVGPQQFWALDPGLFFPEQKLLYSTAGSDVYNHYDPNRAKQLLAQAGYKGDKVVVMATKSYAWMYNAAQVIASNLQAAGVAVDLQIYDWATLLSRRTKPELYDAFITGFSPSIDPTAIIFFDPNWPGWYRSEKMSALLAQWGKTTDDTAKHQLMDQIQQVFYQEVPIVKFGNQFGLNIYAKKLHGYVSFFDIRLWNTWVAA
jgi:peptide/nickel transport system substrate-binding protein